MSQLADLDKMAAARYDLLRAGVNGSIEFADAVGGEAQNLPLALTGYASAAIPVVLGACEERFRETASRLTALASEVEEGAPSLIGIESEHDSEEPKKAKLQRLPLRDIAVLESAYEQAEPQSAVSVLLQNRERGAVSFGDTNADMAVRAVHSSNGIDALPEANFDLKLELIGPDPIDYWAPVTFNLDEGGWAEEMFAGVVQTAEPEGDTAKLKCEGGATVIEHTKGGVLAAHMSAADLIRSMIAQSGWTGELPLSEEPADTTKEEFEVVVPLSGLRIGDPVPVGAVELIPERAGREILEALDLNKKEDGFPALQERFLGADAYARAILTSTTPHEAEDEGVETIETAISWLTTRGRYGTALLPNDSGQKFNREAALVAPELGPVVLVRGIATQRQWLRWWHRPRAETGEHLDGAFGLAPRRSPPPFRSRCARPCWGSRVQSLSETHTPRRSGFGRQSSRSRQ